MESGFGVWPSFVVDLAAHFLGCSGEGSDLSSEGAGLHVSSGETYVMGIAAGPVGPVTRCLGIAEASLSLSLSLDFWPANR